MNACNLSPLDTVIFLILLNNAIWCVIASCNYMEWIGEAEKTGDAATLRKAQLWRVIAGLLVPYTIIYALIF